MSNFQPLYVDTDSATKDAYIKHMNREYISVIVDGNPTVIFKRNIIAVSKDTGHTEITCANDVVFYTKEDYASVVKKIIG